MNFADAVKALSEGANITREAWEGRKVITGVERKKPGQTRPVYAICKVRDELGINTMLPNPEDRAAEDWITVPNEYVLDMEPKPAPEGEGKPDEGEAVGMQVEGEGGAGGAEDLL